MRKWTLWRLWLKLWLNKTSDQVDRCRIIIIIILQNAVTNFKLLEMSCVIFISFYIQTPRSSYHYIWNSHKHFPRLRQLHQTQHKSVNHWFLTRPDYDVCPNSKLTYVTGIYVLFAKYICRKITHLWPLLYRQAMHQYADTTVFFEFKGCPREEEK